MLPATGWGFLTALLIVLVGVYLLSDSFNWGLPLPGSTTSTTTLLCTGGSGAPCCRGDDRSKHTSGLAITIDRKKNNVNVFSEDEGSANGEIIEENDSHLSFGNKCAAGLSANTAPPIGASAGASTSTGADPRPSANADKDKCKVADGNINRLTGMADVTIMDEKGQTVVQWNKIDCKRRSRSF